LRHIYFKYFNVNLKMAQRDRTREEKRAHAWKMRKTGKKIVIKEKTKAREKETHKT